MGNGLAVGFNYPPLLHTSVQHMWKFKCVGFYASEVIIFQWVEQHGQQQLHSVGFGIREPEVKLQGKDSSSDFLRSRDR